MTLDLSQPHRLHVVGVGGAGMSAIAAVLAAMGHRVSGSDLKESAGLARLRALGVDVAVGHAAEHVDDVDAVTISTAVPPTNVEVEAARERGIPVLRRAEALAAVARTRRTVAVAGTHGKTTTASMLALVLVEAGLRPSFIIGGEVNEIGTGAVWDDGEWFVVEADESDGTFLELGTEAALVTNVEPDHLEHYGGFDALVAAFDRFLAEAPGPRVVGADDAMAARLGRAHGAVTYGTAEDADYRMVDVRTARSSVRFGIEHGGSPVGEVSLPVPGLHNARNACGALVTGLALGASFEAAARALARYGGVARRFQFRGERDGVTFVDDYAHLPTEVRAALAAARDGGWKRVVAVFQPHRFSRTEALWRDFADAFVDADVLVLTDVYAAGEAPRPGVSGKLLVHAVLDAHPTARVAYLPTRPEPVAYLRRLLRPGDVCLTLGAGDLTSLPDELLDRTRPDGSGGEFPAVSAGNSPPEPEKNDAVERAAAVLGERARRHVPIGPLTTYRVGGAAALSVEAHTTADLLAVARAVRESGLPVLVVGKGSNLLVADAGFPGIAVVLGAEFEAIEVDGTRVRAGGAAALPVVARRTAAAGLTGFEWAVGVPGSVGGAV
ncbi:MAG TPA: UDP-N-acetylmuramate--L-alanine ligase, partial [Acidimicrobiia bacterium]|nr:UDP-N-acetylmuramate--L-alanine ligase [Acidimicrobiia bacterium]